MCTRPNASKTDFDSGLGLVIEAREEVRFNVIKGVKPKEREAKVAASSRAELQQRKATAAQAPTFSLALSLLSSSVCAALLLLLLLLRKLFVQLKVNVEEEEEDVREVTVVQPQLTSAPVASRNE